jgi:nicotinate-nucleotide pyrophosphorylase (carboxylating)
MVLGVEFQRALDAYLAADLPFGDITTQDLRINHPVKYGIMAKSQGLVCGLPFVEYVLGQASQLVKFKATEGEVITPGQWVVEGEAMASAVLNRERLCLNLLMRLSGIATLTSTLVARAADFGIRLCATRKTTPGFGVFEKYAVGVGGGLSHRYSLSDGYLIKNNHVDVIGNLDLALKRLTSRRRHHVALCVEVRNLEEVDQALKFHPDVLLCDHFSVDQIRETLNRVSGGPTRIELSGDITPENLDGYLIPGVSYISMGALTTHVPVVDFSLRIRP